MDASSDSVAKPVSDAGSVSASDARAPFVPVAKDNPAVVITVDAGANRHAIDPRIYGLAWATQAQLADLAPPSTAGAATP